jgi:hypothetical protein
MTPREYRAYRRALQSPARALVLALEARGATLRLTADRRVSVRPAGLLRAQDRFALRAQEPEVRVLVEHRTAWYDWRSAPVPSWAEALERGPVATEEEAQDWHARHRVADATETR